MEAGGRGQGVEEGKSALASGAFISFLFFFLITVLGFALRAYTLSHSASPFL
jgi:hypothetical protein